MAIRRLAIMHAIEEEPVEGPGHLRAFEGVLSAPPMLCLTQLSNYLTLKGSFSAVSKPNFASKYALELGSIWKALAEIYKMHSFAPFWHRFV